VPSFSSMVDSCARQLADRMFFARCSTGRPLRHKRAAQGAASVSRTRTRTQAHTRWPLQWAAPASSSARARVFAGRRRRRKHRFFVHTVLQRALLIRTRGPKGRVAVPMVVVPAARHAIVAVAVARGRGAADAASAAGARRG
jgi:hypothetical protein